MNILLAFVVLLVLSLALAFILSFVDKKFKVSKDKKLEQLEQIMPGANCGGCGFAGCGAYAQAVFDGESEIGLCSPGGNELAKNMAKIIGVESKEVERKIAYVFCKGSKSLTTYNSKYDGIETCAAASTVFNGSKNCKYGCLGYMSCAEVCSEGGIYKDFEGNVIVDKEKCIGCGQCVKACPNNVIKLVPYSAEYAVACNSKDKGAEVNKACKVGCIGCQICVNKYPQSGCLIENNLSVVDYTRDTSQLEQAAQACPKHIIRKI